MCIKDQQPDGNSLKLTVAEEYLVQEPNLMTELQKNILFPTKF